MSRGNEQQWRVVGYMCEGRFSWGGEGGGERRAEARRLSVALSVSPYLRWRRRPRTHAACVELGRLPRTSLRVDG